MLAAWRSWARVERGLAPRTIEVYERELRRLGPGLASLRESELRVSLGTGDAAASTTARRIAAWRSYYRFLVRTGARADDPTAGLDRPKVHAGLPRPVDDLSRRLAMLSPTMRAVAVLLVETGLRISEACAVQVDRPWPSELVVKGKGGRERVVPLTGLAQQALAALGGRIEPSARTIQRRFAEVGMTPHRLRHSFASSLADADVDLSVIQDLLGHATPATTRVYQRNSASRLRAGMEAGRGSRAERRA